MKPITTKSALLLYGGMLVLLAVTTTTTGVYAQIPTPTTPTIPPTTPTMPPTNQTTLETNATTTATTGTGGGAAQQVIDTVRAECQQSIEVSPELQSPSETGFDFQAILAESCLNLVYESATTIVLDGDLLIHSSPGLYSDNPYIWQAVDQFKAQGYVVETVITTGQGSEGNPHRLYVVMSK